MEEEQDNVQCIVRKVPGLLWNVLHIKPRREKKVSAQCKLYNLPCFLPLREETKIYQRRRVTVQKPVFPGYLFAAFDEPGRFKLLQTNNLVRILVPADEDQFVCELSQVEAALSVDPTLGASATLRKGRFIRITGGPFRGVEGVIDRLKSETTGCLNVDMIGQAIRLEVDKGFIELLD